MKNLSLLLLTLTFITVTPTYAQFDTLKTDENIYDELVLTLPSYTDSSGSKYFFQADPHTADNICRTLGKRGHHDYGFRSNSGKKVVSTKIVRYRYDDKLVKGRKNKTNVIYQLKCSSIDLNGRRYSNNPQDEGRIRRSLHNWSIRLRL